jgi:hypothetical protein
MPTTKRDLLVAGIAKLDENGKIDLSDEDGRIVDFHALRTSLGSHLAEAAFTPRS